MLLDGCQLDTDQLNTLHSQPTRQVISEVILLCVTVQDNGTVGFRRMYSRPSLAAQISDLHAQGYKVSLGVTATDPADASVEPGHLAPLLQDPTWRAGVIAGLTDLATLADGLELALPPIPDASRSDLSSLVSALGPQVRPGKTLGVFVPPSVMEPSDIEGGNAYDVSQLATQTDRLRLMTLDFSCCASTFPPGPTIDAQWALDAAHLALRKTTAAKLDVAMPLYGTDFTLRGDLVEHSFVTYEEALELADQHDATLSRGAGDSPRFGYKESSGTAHQVYYQDSRFTLRTLAAWTADSLPLSIGVVYYALGAEDPTLWSAVAQAQR